MRKIIIGLLLLLSVGANSQWQQTGSKVRYVNGLGIPTKDTAAGVSADSSQIVIRPADSALYIKYKRTWVKVGSGGTIGGSGTTNRVSKFTGATTLGNSSIVDSASAVAMTINTNGNIGIGSTFPTNTGGFSKQLQVEGTYPALTLKNITGTTSSYSFGANSSGDIEIWNNNTSSSPLYIKSTGNVGIGYTAPAAKLAVSGTTLINTNTDNGVDKLQVSGSLIATNLKKSGGLSTEYLKADGSVSTLTNPVTGTGTSGQVAFWNGTTTQSGNSNLFWDNTNSRLGIGETSPATDLYIKNSSVDLTGYYVENTTAGASAAGRRLAVGMGGSTAFGNANWVNSGIIEGQTANGLYIGFTGGTLRFGSSSRATRMTMLENGNFLINTTTDNGVDKLQVEGSISGIGMKQSYVTKTGAYTATNADYVIDCTSGTFTVTLPASSGRTGRILIIKNSGAGTITVDGNGAETIDGAATYSLATQYATVQIMSDGTNWKIIAKF